MKQKINLRLSLIAILAVFLTSLGIISVFYNLFQTQVKDDLHTNAQLLVDTELFQNIYEETGGTMENVESNAALKNLESDNIRITWISSDGTVLYDNDTDAAEMTNHLDRPEIQDAITNGTGECVRRSSTFNMNTFYYALRMEDGTILRVSTQARSVTSVFFTAMPVILTIVLLILIICIILGHYLTQQLIRPIGQMAENMDEPLEIPVYKELEPFADKIRSQHENILAAATSRQDFTAAISHELKTPLTAISGYAELIENRMIDPEQEVHIAEQIHHNSDRLLSLINDIIKLSELDHAEMPKNFTGMDLYSLAKECCQDLKVNADKKDLRLSCSGNPEEMNGDRDLLKELIENLIQNSIQYNHPGGYVRVRVSSENGHPFVSVSDNGIGIAKDQQERIFERFYRVDKSRSRETGGTGLGLAIVKHIAEIHNAKIQIDSFPGRGTTISVEF